MINNIVVIYYAVYLLISAALTIWLGKTLFKNGRIFLMDTFNHNEPMVDSVNHLVLVGFYLITFGIVVLFLRYGTKPQNIVDSIEFMSTKIGIVLLLLVVMHFLNVFGIAKMRYKSLDSRVSEESMAALPDTPPETREAKELKLEERLHYPEVDNQFDTDDHDLLQPVTNGTGR